MKAKKDHKFAVVTKDYHLMSAFKSACESIGWKYNEKWIEFNEKNTKRHDGMYFTSNWTHREKSDYLFSLTGLSGGGDRYSVYKLPKDWDVALEKAKEIINYKNKEIVALNDKYEAEVDYHKKEVVVGCQTFSFSKIAELYKATTNQ